MTEKMQRHIVSFPGWLTNDILAYANERGQTFSGAVREITRLRIMREKRKKKIYDENKDLPGRNKGRGSQ